MKLRSRRTLWLSIAILVVLAAGAAFVMKTRSVATGNAAAADSTGADSTTVADKDDKKDKKKGDKDKKEEAPVPVEVAAVMPRSISTYYVTTATLEPEKKVDILAKIAGEVKQILVEEGDVVKEGALLCRLDDAELKVLLDEARINRDQQKLELERVESMRTQNLISDKEYQAFKYQHDLAVNRYESARVKYEYTQIRAPFAGIVTRRLVDPGENIAVGAQLFMMADTQPLLLSMYLPETEARTVRAGQTVFIRPDNEAGTQFDGSILRIAPEVDQRTGTVKVTAQTRGGGIPGSFVRVRILTDTHVNVLAVPRRSVTVDSGDRFVYVAAADTVRRAVIGVGFEDEEYAEVTGGLAEGDSVVTAGVGGIRDGSRVRVVRPDDVASSRRKPATGTPEKK